MMLISTIKHVKSISFNNAKKIIILPTLDLLTNFSSHPIPSSENPNKNLKVSDYRNVYVEFLPDPNVEFRNPIREKLERLDMLARRTHIDIPEFYVGSILAVTSSDSHSIGKTNRFVGICIKREGCGLRAKFLLRNVIDHQGVEILYEMYDPALLKIEVLRLEKRLDDELLYLRDALAEYSTFDPNMEMELLPEGASVPINTLKVKLKPETMVGTMGKEKFRRGQELQVSPRDKARAEKVATPWLKHDLMKIYMKTIPEQEQIEIFTEIQPELQQLELTRKKLKRKRSFVKPFKLG